MTPGHLLSLFDVVCLGINAIVGSGIYAFPGVLAAELGPISFLAFACCGAVAALIGLCFAEAAGRFERSGGPYLYARAAFGEGVGYLVGWTCWTSALLSWAAVARTIPPYLTHLWSSSGLPRKGIETAVAASIVLALGGINLWGLRPGALATDVLTLAKLIPLLVLVGAGLLSGRLVPRGPLAPHGYGALPRAAFSTFFAFQGFEVVPVPAGETTHPRRNAPLAVLISISGATILYMVIQWEAVATTPALAGAEQPLAEMGRTLLGSFGGKMVAGAAVISMLGFCAGVALAGPRYLTALAEDGHLPPRLADPRFGTPHLAIAITSLLTALLVVFFDFGSLVDLSVLSVSVQYLSTCLALPVMRKKAPEQKGPFRLPLGPLVPLSASAVTLWLISQAKLREVALFAVVCAVGLIPLGLWRWWRSRSRRKA